MFWIQAKISLCSYYWCTNVFLEIEGNLYIDRKFYTLFLYIDRNFFTSIEFFFQYVWTQITYVLLRICVYVYTQYIYIYVLLHICVYVCTQYIYMCTYTYVCMYIHNIYIYSTHTHTCTYMLLAPTDGVVYVNKHPSIFVCHYVYI